MTTRNPEPRLESPATDQSLADLLDPYAVGRDAHVNAPAFVVRPDEVQAALSTLRDAAGFDHCSCVTAQEYEDRYETIYHLRKYADPTDEVSVVVPAPTSAPVSESASSVYETANWHEREAYDLRRDDPYGYYDELDWSVVTGDGCDNYARLLVRLREVEESAKIIEQCVDLLEDWPEDERTIHTVYCKSTGGSPDRLGEPPVNSYNNPYQSNVPRTIRPDDDTEIYRAVEAAKGELGIYIRADGTEKPARFKIRGPSFSNLQALPKMSNGEYVPDLIATLGSLDTIMGEVDR